MWPAAVSAATAASRASRRSARGRAARAGGARGEQALGGVEEIDGVELEVHERLADAGLREAGGGAGTGDAEQGADEREARAGRDLDRQLDEAAGSARARAPAGAGAVGARRRGEHARGVEDRAGDAPGGAHTTHRRGLGQVVRRTGEDRGVEAHRGLVEDVEEGVVDGVPGRAKPERSPPRDALDRLRAGLHLAEHRRAIEASEIVPVAVRVVLHRVPAPREDGEDHRGAAALEILADGEERERDPPRLGPRAHALEGEIVGLVGGVGGGREPVNGEVVVEGVEIDRDRREPSSHRSTSRTRKPLPLGARDRGHQQARSRIRPRPSWRLPPRSRRSSSRCLRRARSARSARPTPSSRRPWRPARGAW